MFEENYNYTGKDDECKKGIFIKHVYLSNRCIFTDISEKLTITRPPRTYSPLFQPKFLYNSAFENESSD
jgi:hypothetical protein